MYFVRDERGGGERGRGVGITSERTWYGMSPFVTCDIDMLDRAWGRLERAALGVCAGREVEELYHRSSSEEMRRPSFQLFDR